MKLYMHELRGGVLISTDSTGIPLNEGLPVTLKGIKVVTVIRRAKNVVKKLVAGDEVYSYYCYDKGQSLTLDDDHLNLIEEMDFETVKMSWHLPQVKVYWTDDRIVLVG